MIKITNGQMTLTVPNAAYHTIYKSSGFHPIDGEESIIAPADAFPTLEEKTPRKEVFVEETEDAGEFDGEEDDRTAEETIDLSEIPLSEMDFYQLCDYADQLGLDHRGIRSKKELRALIRNNI